MPCDAVLCKCMPCDAVCYAMLCNAMLYLQFPALAISPQVVMRQSIVHEVRAPPAKPILL
eukprot:6319129-Pyramimonas_sp.AAC.1